MKFLIAAIAALMMAGCTDKDLYDFIHKPAATVPCDADNCGKLPQ